MRVKRGAPLRVSRYRCTTCSGFRRVINVETGKTRPCPSCNGTSPNPAHQIRRAA